MRNLKNKRLKYKRRGFSLMELMVALTGGLAITTAVFMFTRDMTRFFQRQMKLSETTLSAVSGFERLRRDIARAGYMSSPNLARDAQRCPKPATGGIATAPVQVGGDLTAFPGIEEMGLLRILYGSDRVQTYTGNYVFDNNGGRFDPDELMLYGNYTTTEVFPVASQELGSNQIHLELNSTAMARIGVPTSPSNVTADVATLSAIFPAGSIIRIMDETSRIQHAILANPPVSFAVHPLGYPTLLLNPAVQVITKEGASGTLCGVRGQGTGLIVNPVNMIRYELRSLVADPNYARFFDADLAAPDYDSDRTELVRIEMLPNLTDDASSLELIAEYAVDLKFGLTVNTNILTGGNTYLPEDDGGIPDYADVPFGTTAGQLGAFGPHLIRGVHARLSLRTRDANERSYILSGTPLSNATSADLYRVEVAAGKFAEMRSLRAHVATRNSRRETWN